MHRTVEEAKPIAQHSKFYILALFGLMIAGLFKYSNSQSPTIIEPDEMTLRLSLFESKKIQNEYEDKLFIYFQDPRAKNERAKYIYDIENPYEESHKFYDIENNTRLEEAELLFFVEEHNVQYQRDLLTLFWTQLPTIRDIILIEGVESLMPINCSHAVAPYPTVHGLVNVTINPFFSCYGWDDQKNLNSIYFMESFHRRIAPGFDFHSITDTDNSIRNIVITSRNNRLMETINASIKLFKYGLAKIFVLIGSGHVYPSNHRALLSSKLQDLKPEDPRKTLANFLQNHRFAIFSPKNPTQLAERIQRPKRHKASDSNSVPHTKGR